MHAPWWPRAVSDTSTSPRRVPDVEVDDRGPGDVVGPAGEGHSPTGRAAAATGRPVVLVCGPHGRAAADLLPGVSDIVEFHAPWIEPEP